MYTYEAIAKMIDHSLVNPTLTADQLEEGLALARAYDVASVSIMPFYLARAAEVLASSGVNAGATVGFPHGSHKTSIKVAEAVAALNEGAAELDMVCNVSQVLSGKWKYVLEDIHAVVDAAHAAGAKLKVIFENCFLNREQKIRLCEICGEAGADWLKTSTGYASGGATMEDLELMVKHAPAGVQVKAAGGIRDFESLLRVRELGVTRVGATRTSTMLDACRERLGLAQLRLRNTATSTY